MSLPKLTAPIFTIEMPSNKKSVKFRPFTVKEEKLLLLASESEEPKFINDTITQVLNNCFIDDIDIGILATFDVEYLFIQLRAKSVNNIVKLRFKDDNDKVITQDIDLEDVKVHFDPNHTNKIQLNDEVSMIMKYPSFNMIEKMSTNDNKELTEVISACIDKVYTAEEVMDLNDYTQAEVTTFIESFTSKNMREIEAFFNSLPKLKLDILYKDEETGDMIKREVSGLLKFFYLLMSYNSLTNYYSLNFQLMQHHKYSLSDINEMLPFERDLYVDMLMAHTKRRKRTTTKG